MPLRIRSSELFLHGLRSVAAVSPNLNDAWRETFQFDDNFPKSLSAPALRSIEQGFGPLEAGVGFVAKSAFWLGVVYSAIPFDLGKPNAFAPITAAMPYAASYPLGTFASEAATAWRQSTDDRRPAAVAAILRARNCSRPAPARLRSDDNLTSKDRRSHACFPERSG
jgi:hypothetical protein